MNGRCDFCPRAARMATCMCAHEHRVGVWVCAEKHEGQLAKTRAEAKRAEIMCRLCMEGENSHACMLIEVPS